MGRSRSEIMRAVRRRDTEPELTVRRVAHSLGLRFRLHRPDLPGSPDIVFPKYRTCIFVHGCFWHRHQGCRRATTPKTRQHYWIPKFEQNRVRDSRVRAELEKAGWRVEVIWECETLDAFKLEQRLREIFSLPQGARRRARLPRRASEERRSR